MTDLQPVPGIPALKIGDTLVIGDLHIGVEAHLGAKGIHLTSRTDTMFDAVIEAAGTDVDRIIMIGDIKDSVPGSTRQEYREIPNFCDRLLEHFTEVCIVRGNHDTSIEEFVPGAVRIYPATGMSIGNIGLIHGHTWPSEQVMAKKTLVMGHCHPTVLFKDGVGAHISEPCWVRGRFTVTENERYPILPESFIIVPAFNRMLGGSPVNAIGTPLLGPIMNSDIVDLENARLYLLDGIDLGRRETLMVKDRQFKRWNDDENSPRHSAL
ncbi:phosphoesterase [Candidatus Methanomethylophilus alvi Mx1201]|uniref:Phosphoesterase n=2 Tax=Methanomethylophilus alvi TaxID=1291540 RepID=M9SFQ2_METAX|nr:metallophosphoesterase [Methanomethylophilus alvi]AGI85058.1 phosphoesterase [Candidatus Methanomethylophilus alvi Mx1201]AYQ54495.1 phosphoesterase [Methanomethylophilus alvi]